MPAVPADHAPPAVGHADPTGRHVQRERGRVPGRQGRHGHRPALLVPLQTHEDPLFVPVRQCAGPTDGHTGVPAVPGQGLDTTSLFALVTLGYLLSWDKAWEKGINISPFHYVILPDFCGEFQNHTFL